MQIFDNSDGKRSDIFCSSEIQMETRPLGRIYMGEPVRDIKTCPFCRFKPAKTSGPRARYDAQTSPTSIVSMTYSEDFRWRAVALLHAYIVPIVHVSELLGPKLRSIRRWNALFVNDDVFNDKQEHQEKHTK